MAAVRLDKGPSELATSHTDTATKILLLLVLLPFATSDTNTTSSGVATVCHF